MDPEPLSPKASGISLKKVPPKRSATFSNILDMRSSQKGGAGSAGGHGTSGLRKGQGGLASSLQQHLQQAYEPRVAMARNLARDSPSSPALVRWLGGWWVGQLVGWLVDWSVDLSVGWLVGQLNSPISPTLVSW